MPNISRSNNSFGIEIGKIHFWFRDESVGKKKPRFSDGHLHIWYDGNTLFETSWYTGSSARRAGLVVELCPEEGPSIGIQVGLPFIVWLFVHFGKFPSWIKNRIQHGYDGRETGIMLSWQEEPALSSYFWYSEGVYKHAGWHNFVLLNNVFFGRNKYSSVEHGTHPGAVTLPERSYPVNITLTTDTWKRPRWPWPTVIERAKIECGEDGIPDHAGKGENDWDQEDDYVISMTFPVPADLSDQEKVEYACQVLAKRIVANRTRYGQPDEVMKSIIQRNIVEKYAGL